MDNNGNFTRNVAIAIGSLLIVAGFGWNAFSILNEKANAEDLEVLAAQVQSIRTDHAVTLQANVDIARRLTNIESQLNAIAKALGVVTISP